MLMMISSPSPRAMTCGRISRGGQALRPPNIGWNRAVANASFRFEMKLRQGRIFSLLVLGCGLAGASISSYGQTIINTIAGWDGISTVFSFSGDPGVTQTYGETVTVPIGDHFLSSFQFEIEPTLNTSLTIKAYVYAWDDSVPSSPHASGPALYTSVPTTIIGPTSGPLSFQNVTFSPGSLSLSPGQKYVIFASSTGLGGNGTANWGQPNGANPYSGGDFVYINNSTTLDWTTTAWSVTLQSSPVTNDLAFKATFVPEPGTWALLGFGLALLAFASGRQLAIHRRRDC